MGSSVYEQLRALIAAGITGAALALVCDLTGLFTPRSRFLSLFLLELPFLLFGAFAVFVIGQRSGEGMSLFFLLAVSAGFFLYLGLIHESVSAYISHCKHDLHTYSTKIGNRCAGIYFYFVNTLKKYKK